MHRSLILLALVLVPVSVIAQEQLLAIPSLASEDKLKLLESSIPITPEQVFAQDAAAQFKQILDCGGIEGINSYFSQLYGRQELHYAAVHGDALRVKQLILEKADINVRDNMMATPLTLAAGNGRLEIVKMLLEAGADLTIKNGLGQTAYDCAVAEGWPEVQEFLRPYYEGAAPKPEAAATPPVPH